MITRRMDVRGQLWPDAARTWRDPDAAPRYVALLVHGYGEHIGRYEHVAAALVAHDAVVYGPDHVGHGKSGGDRVVVDDFDDVVADLGAVHATARAVAGLPIVLLGHSMGGMIAARYAQLHADELVALGPVGPGHRPVRPAGDDGRPGRRPRPADRRGRAVTRRGRGARYADDPLVWHGPFQRPTVEAMAATVAAIDAGAAARRVAADVGPR